MENGRKRIVACSWPVCFSALWSCLPRCAEGALLCHPERHRKREQLGERHGRDGFRAIWLPPKVAMSSGSPPESTGPSDTDRIVSFSLKSGVSLYGGFAGDETELNQRDWSVNITVLTGDIDENDDTDPNGVTETKEDIVGSNSYSVTFLAVNVSNTAVLDGFVVTGGNADGNGTAEPGRRHVRREQQRGDPNSSFIGNFAARREAASDPQRFPVTNCYFSGKRRAGRRNAPREQRWSGSRGIALFPKYRALPGRGTLPQNSDVSVSSSTFSGNRPSTGRLGRRGRHFQRAGLS